MQKLIVLAALVFAPVTVHQAAACDFGAHAANATPIVVACTGSDCATEESTTRQPAAKPEPVAPKVIATTVPVPLTSR